jgi:hypothetical protein
MMLGFCNPGTEKKGYVGVPDPGNGFDRPAKASIDPPLPKGEGNMNRLAGLNLTHQSLRSTIRQEQIQLTHLRKQDNNLFIRASAGTKGAKNTARNFIKPGWPIVPIAKSLSLVARKPRIRSCAGVTSRPKRHLQLGSSFSRIGKGFLGECKPTQKIFQANAINQAIQAISGSPIFENTRTQAR